MTCWPLCSHGGKGRKIRKSRSILIYLQTVPFHVFLLLATPKEIYRSTESEAERDVSFGLVSFPTWGRTDHTFITDERSWPDSFLKADGPPAHRESRTQVGFIGQDSSRVHIQLSQRPPLSTSEPHGNMLHLISATSSLVQNNSLLIHIHQEEEHRNSGGISKGAASRSHS